MSGRRVIAVSPTPESLGAAAACRGEWDELCAGGRKLVVDTLRAWAAAGDIAHAVVAVPSLADASAARAALADIVRAGGRVVWLAPGRDPVVRAAADGLAGVALHRGATFAEALRAWAPAGGVRTGPLAAVGTGDADLEGFIRFKKALFLMQEVDPRPLAEAVDVLAAATEAAPTRAIGPADRASVAHFRAADFPYLEGKSVAIGALKRRIRAVAGTSMSVLVLGETGTGKEAVAFYLHALGRRRAGPLVSLNCAGLDRALLRSELFGHVRGAFTGADRARRGLVAEADGGTLFLDEIGDMPLSVQAALLRFLQTKRYRPVGGAEERAADVRILAAGQPSLAVRRDRGEFRDDLYHRIAEVELHTPALRDVPDDVLRVARHLVFHLAAEVGGPESGAVRDCLAYLERGRDVLVRHPWRGNVRELANRVKRRLLLGDDVLAELSDAAVAAPDGPAGIPLPSGPDDIRRLDDVTRTYARHAHAHRGGLTQAELALRLGRSVNTLKRILWAD